MKGRKALKLIELRLKERHSKKEIYDELFGQVKFRTDLLQLLAMVPNYDDRLIYRKLNLLLFSLIVIAATSKILTSIHLFINISIYMLPFVAFVALMSIFFAVMVFKFRGFVYRFLGLFGSAGILNELSKYEEWSSFNLTAWILKLLLGYIPAIMIVILAFYIGFKVFPYYGFWGMLQEKELSF